MKKGKQILALVGVVFLVGLYIITFIASFTASENSAGLFLACVYATIVIPVLFWTYAFFYKLLGKKNEADVKDEQQEQ